MKFILSCVLIYMHVCAAHNIRPNKNSRSNKNYLRIVGGRNATDDEFPYVVKIMLQSLATRMQANIFICSGAVLTSKWTLTAGHCITSMYQMISTAVIQTKGVIEYQPSPKSEVAYSEVMTTTLHPNINFQPVRNDIGLLHTQPVLFAKYGKLSSLDYATLNGQQVSLVGYGMIKNVNDDPPRVPQVLEVMVKECPDTFHYPQVCFAPSCTLHLHDFKAICLGDSGGPAVHATGIVSINTMTDVRNCGIYNGATSRRDRYDTGHDVGTATPISPFTDWISSVLKLEVNK